ncbi:MAG TPA: type III PLP-dependent enzyme [Candidatus Saccharimonadales bacterium]|jgi:ornithine decarboxylase|nr:type III PLP-dependent enzyme [Candidatus Saccharimonadales bacterium]
MSIPIIQESDLLQQARLLNYKTPFFFTQRSILKHNYHTFTHLFDNVEIYYALKANSDPKILGYLNQLGCGFEAASAFEIEMLLDVGVEPSNIIYGTSIKPAEHISQAFKSGIKRFAADSKEEIDKIAENAPGSKVFVRAIVDDDGSVFMMSERFGAPAEIVKDLVLYARSLDLKTYGLSFYVGSQAAHANMWAKGVRRVKPIIEALKKEGVVLEVLNIGGGFPVHYNHYQDTPELRDIVVKVHNELHTLPYIPKLIMEPGRAMVATSTVLVSEVIARNDRSGKPWLCLDAGIYNALFEAMIHQGSTRYPAQMLNPPTEPAETELFTLAGPTGDSLDIIARGVELPTYVGIGDKLVFENAGAYTHIMASHFNGFPIPPLYIS